MLEKTGGVRISLSLPPFLVQRTANISHIPIRPDAGSVSKYNVRF